MSGMTWTQHLILAPILLPLLAGAILIPVNEARHGLKFALKGQPSKMRAVFRGLLAFPRRRSFQDAYALKK